ncbi:AMP-binding protein [Alteromonas sp. H39]|uniref:AMP-binding protein n=1 Tax=Alteromonas sp. H39 TaxID=3389876 RepID=UPI0039DFC789
MILRNANQWPDNVALESGSQQIRYGQLVVAVSMRAKWLKAQKVRRIALLADNGPEWVMCDLACQQADIVLVPVPSFFTSAQQTHLLSEAGIELVISDRPLDAEETAQCPFEGCLAYHRHVTTVPAVPKGTGKITFTSGSTGTPKGVCLSTLSQHVVAQSLVASLKMPEVRHICVLPLATLLENVAGVYAPLLVGGTVVLPNDTMRGFHGSRLVAPNQFLSCLTASCAQSMILVPELLQLLVSVSRQGWRLPETFTFVAVGGAAVPEPLVIEARKQGVPVYQGYGLSECVSVTTLNLPDKDRAGSAGQALGHNRLTIENDEIVARGTHFLGYLNMPESFYPAQVRTGDLAREEDGYWFIHGRRKNLIINSLGRNISPEWIESALMATGQFARVMVVGEGKPHCGALLLPADNTLSDSQIQPTLDYVNASLPDYARVVVWHRLAAIPDDQNLLTANGKMRRDSMTTYYSSQIEAMYQRADMQLEECNYEIL